MSQAPSSRQSAVRRPVVATADDALLDHLVELASVAGVELDVARDLPALRQRWSAPLVLLGHDLARRVAETPLTRRPGVVLVSTDLDDAGVWELAVHVGAEHVAILPDARAWLTERVGESARGAGRAVVVAVVGGRGGAGASCLAAALAVTARRDGRAAVLVDADPLGGGIDLLVGAEEVEGLRWSDLAHASGRLPSRALVDALPGVDGLRVLSWDRGERLHLPREPLRAVLAGVRESAELVVVDLPRSGGAEIEAVLGLTDTVLLVVPAEVRAAAAAGRVARALATQVSDVRVVVRGPAPAGLDPDLVARSLGLPLAGVLTAEPGLAEAIERGDAPGGTGRGPLARFARQFLAGAIGAPAAA